MAHTSRANVSNEDLSKTGVQVSKPQAYKLGTWRRVVSSARNTHKSRGPKTTVFSGSRFDALREHNSNGVATLVEEGENVESDVEEGEFVGDGTSGFDSVLEKGESHVVGEPILNSALDGNVNSENVGLKEAKSADAPVGVANVPESMVNGEVVENEILEEDGSTFSDLPAVGPLDSARAVVNDSGETDGYFVGEHVGLKQAITASCAHEASGEHPLGVPRPCPVALDAPVVSNVNALHTILNDVEVYEDAVNARKEATATSSAPAKSFVCGFNPGFLQSPRPSSVFPPVTPLAAADSPQSADAGPVLDGALDGFLLTNFNLPAPKSRGRGRGRPPKKKEKPIHLSPEESIRATIAKLGEEVEAWNLDPITCAEKRKLMELMKKNSKSQDTELPGRDKGKKPAVNVNPYANIAPPLGYKPRPPDPIVHNLPPLSKIAKFSSACLSPTTRSRSRDRKTSPFDNG